MAAAAAAACITLGPVVADAAAACRCGYVSYSNECCSRQRYRRPCCAAQRSLVVSCVLFGQCCEIDWVWCWDGRAEGRRMRTE